MKTLREQLATLTVVDLETLGNRPGAVILSIGAARKGPDMTEEVFSVNVDAASCEAAGLRCDASTALWWMRQSDAARAVHTVQKCLPLRDALTRFSSWWRLGDQFYGMANFDAPVLLEAYRAVGLQPPWHFRDERCYRTVRELFGKGLEPEPIGFGHVAVDDAVWELRHLARIFHHLQP